MKTPKSSAQFEEPEDEFSGQFDDEVEDDFADLEDEFADDDDWDDDPDDDDLDDEFDDDLSEEEELLGAFFAGGDFEIVELTTLLRESQDEPDPTAADVRATATLEEVIEDLRERSSDVSLTDLAALANVPAAEREELRALWPTVPVQARRSALEALIDAASEDLPLDLSELLRLALEDADDEVRQLGIAGLFDNAAPEFLGRLTQMTRRDLSSAVRAAAATALGNYVLAGELDELEPALAMRAEEALMASLADADEMLAVQCAALESIAYSGEVGVRQLIEDAYYSEHDEMRQSSLTAMGRSADVRWRNLARAELSNPSPQIRARAAFAVGELEARAALPEVLALVDDDDFEVRIAAIYALGHLGGSEARAVLEDLSNSEDDFVADAADEALEEMAFYASADAQNLPLYDEEEDDDDWRFASDADLGIYN